MNTEKTEIGLHKIYSFRWEYNETIQEEYVLNVKDFLAKSAVWAEKFNKINNFPFFNFTKCISENEYVSEHYHQEVDKYFEDFYYVSPHIRATCHWYLEWLNLDEQAKNELLSLPDPFEPLVSLYEKGGHFRIENKFLWLNNLGLPINDYSKYFQF